MAAIDPARIRTSQDLAEQLAVLSARYPHGMHCLATAAKLSVATVHALITGRTAIPRARTLENFVKACGQDPVPWLDARARLVGVVRSEKVEPAPDPAHALAGLLGRVIGEMDERDALALEVHQAFAATGTTSEAAPVSVLPPYLDRAGFDDRLRRAVAAAEHGSRLVMVIGGSSTGKTRACWEAIRAVLPDWRVWHPLTPERPMAVVDALRGGQVAARSVIWLNEAQYYLQPPHAGEHVATELQALLADGSRGPVLVLGSMWPDFWRMLTETPEHSSAPDLHRAARALLSHAEDVTSPPCFAPRELTELASAISADPRLAAATERAPGGQITQELAGAPELLRRYHCGGPAVQAVLWAAMDARRLGHSPYLPEPLLRDSAPAYLDAHTWDQVGDTDWFITALDELTAHHRRLPGPLIEYRPRPGEPHPPSPLYRLADYLEQHGRRERALLCPPAAFWNAAAQHARTPADLTVLGVAAADRGRYHHATHLYQQAADAGRPDAQWNLARLRERARDQAGAEQLARQAADAGHPDALWNLARLREQAGDRKGAEPLFQLAADAGQPDALHALARLREQAGDQDEAERLARQAADAGHRDVLHALARLRELAGDQEGAERLFQQAVDAGDSDALWNLAQLREQAGDQEWAERLYRQAAAVGDPDVLWNLARLREQAGDREGAERLFQQAFEAGDSDALWSLARLREQAGDQEGAERLARQAADTGHSDAMRSLAQLREQAGDRKGAERLFELAVDAGDSDALHALVRLREQAGDQEAAERLARQALDAGAPDPLRTLARLREQAGDRKASERLARQAADAGHPDALWDLAELREEAGDQEGAERLARQAADAGRPDALRALARLREQASDRKGAERLYRLAVAAGQSSALHALGRLREFSADHEGAERLYQQAVDAGRPSSLRNLARLRELAGDHEGAERLYQQAVDAGQHGALLNLALMREEAGDKEGAEQLLRVGLDINEEADGP